jgi:hypothetical protein
MASRSKTNSPIHMPEYRIRRSVDQHQDLQSEHCLPLRHSGACYERSARWRRYLVIYLVLARMQGLDRELGNSSAGHRTGLKIIPANAARKDGVGWDLLVLVLWANGGPKNILISTYW